MSDEAGRPCRVLLVDDHQLLAQAIAISLGAESVDARLADLSDRDRLLAAVAADPPDLVLLDLHLGVHQSGITLVDPLTKAGSRVLVVTGSTDRQELAAAVEAGAVGIVSKSQPLGELVATILKATRGEDVMTSRHRAELVEEAQATREARALAHAPFQRLTSRESQVLRALANGRSVSAIARDWVVAEATVRSQVRGVLTKLGVSSQLEAVATAMRSGWLTGEK